MATPFRVAGRKRQFSRASSTLPSMAGARLLNHNFLDDVAFSSIETSTMTSPEAHPVASGRNVRVGRNNGRAGGPLAVSGVPQARSPAPNLRRA
jgi:hypothetical protein